MTPRPNPYLDHLLGRIDTALLELRAIREALRPPRGASFRDELGYDDPHWSTRHLNDYEVRLYYGRIMSRAASSMDEAVEEIEAKLDEAREQGLLATK